MNENKVPCGGFRIGDGLTMEGDTLKSLGGAYIKVNTNNGETFEFADDSPLKTFEEIRQKIKTSLVTLQLHTFNVANTTLSLEYDSDDEISFYVLFISANNLRVTRLFINSDNTITSSVFTYTLTPAT